jgi:hypothetical protein
MDRMKTADYSAFLREPALPFWCGQNLLIGLAYLDFPGPFLVITQSEELT